ncbi:TetR/AcrR family transcriptional regulator [Mycobacterium asiaticum]|uniref:TetR/AcrR family transcriptional regulator n=1 Tax=Mycobacterium asiaticum TaxID=1790 RepID=UPI00056658D6|nr:TetR/AcrR family transcriptional regulator [Mycobacterium asiaticum]ORA11593.1 TetR family transcriptional regulator [Mycobacterium asiaticum DSM 44297]
MFEKAAAGDVSSRRPVVQRRGRERVQAILDAASALLSEQGYEAATLKAAGERAGIPTASLYHYFSDRHQVDAELARRHLRELEAELSTVADNTKLRTLRDAIDAVIDPYVAYFREHRDFLQLWFAGRSPTLSALARTFDEMQARRFWGLLLDRNLIGSDTPEFVVQLAFEAGNRLFDVAFRLSPTGDDTTIDEARRLLTAYLETYKPKQSKARRPAVREA